MPTAFNFYQNMRHVKNGGSFDRDRDTRTELIKIYAGILILLRRVFTAVFELAG